MTDKDYAKQSKLWVVLFVCLLVLDAAFACLTAYTSGSLYIIFFVLLGVSILISICTAIYTYIIIYKWNNLKIKEILLEESKKEKKTN